MCLIVHAKAGVAVPRDLIEDAFYGNSNGFGLMWFEDGQVRVVKDHDMRPAQIDELVSGTLQFERVLHFRMATHGGVNHSNTHPFEIVPGMHMMHNGILPCTAARGSGDSDTAVFVKDVVRPLVEAGGYEALDNAGVVNLIDHMRGSGNRLVFMDGTGQVRIFGRELGVEWKDLWCSNTYAWTLWDDRPKSTGATMYPYITKSHSSMLTYGSKGWDADYFNRDDDDALYDKWLEQSEPVQSRTTGLQVVESKATSKSERYIPARPQMWETSQDYLVDSSVADVLSMTEDEMYDLMEREPEKVVEFIAAMVDLIGYPVDTVDQ